MKPGTILTFGLAAVWLFGFGHAGGPRFATADDIKAKIADSENDGAGKRAAKLDAAKIEADEKREQPEAEAAKKRGRDELIIEADAAAKVEVIEVKGKNALGAAFEALDAVVDVFANGVRGAARNLNQEQALVKQFEQQYGAVFRRLLFTELHFVRVVCGPTKRQYEQIAAAGEKELKTVVRRLAQAEGRRRGGGWAGASQPNSDPRALIADTLLKSVQATLSPEQAARYQSELETRAAARKRVALLNFVAKLDKDLVLAPEQRGKLSEVLDDNWQDSWSQIQMLMYGDNYFPRLPDDKVLPLLNETQKEAWTRIPKQENVFFGWHDLGFLQGIELEEEEVWEEQPAAAQDPAEAKPPATTESNAEAAP